MEANSKDYKVGLQVAGNPITAHARIREQTNTEATLFIRLRMFAIGSECHLRNKKGFLRPVLFEDVYSLVMPDNQVWVHLKLTFKHANTNDQAEDADAPVQIETPAYGVPIQCLINVSAPRYMLVRTNLFAFIQKDAEGTLEDPQTNSTRRVKIEDAFVGWDADATVPEFVVRIKYLDAAVAAPEPKPDQPQDHIQRDSPIPQSDPRRPSVLLSRMSEVPEIVRDSELFPEGEQPPARKMNAKDLRKKWASMSERAKKAWKPVNDLSARYGKIGLALLTFIAVCMVGLILFDNGNRLQGIATNASGSAASQSSSDISGAPSAASVTLSASAGFTTTGAPPTPPVSMSASTGQPTTPAASDSATPVAFPVAACIKMTPKNLRLFYLQSDPECMSGKIAGVYNLASLHVSCANEPAYDQARKCSDVSNCEICLPSEFAAPGSHEFTDKVAQAYYYQSSASCFVEPSLPFRVDPKDLRQGLRIDVDCPDFSFDPIRNCFDYSKCQLIVPAYEK